MTVAAELSAALHHSRDGERVPYVDLRAQKTDSTAVEEEEVHEAHVVPREQKRPPPGERPVPLPEAAGAPSLAVVLVSDMMHDDATVQFLLAGSCAGGGGGGEGAGSVEAAGGCACGG